MLNILDEKYPDMASCARKIFQQEFKLPSNLLIVFASGEIRQIASVEKRQFGSAEIRQFESIEKSQS